MPNKGKVIMATEFLSSTKTQTNKQSFLLKNPHILKAKNNSVPLEVDSSILKRYIFYFAYQIASKIKH